MGTNYYLYQNVCDHCHRSDEPKHIGKSSLGWCFALHVYPKEGILDVADWLRRFSEPNSTIKDQHGDIITSEVMMNVIAERSWPESCERDWEWFARNKALPGPHGLARSIVDCDGSTRIYDTTGCIKHGNGTWDCFVGEFS